MGGKPRTNRIARLQLATARLTRPSWASPRRNKLVGFCHPSGSRLAAKKRTLMGIETVARGRKVTHGLVHLISETLSHLLCLPIVCSNLHAVFVLAHGRRAHASQIPTRERARAVAQSGTRATHNVSDSGMTTEGCVLDDLQRPASVYQDCRCGRCGHAPHPTDGTNLIHRLRAVACCTTFFLPSVPRWGSPQGDGKHKSWEANAMSSR